MLTAASIKSLTPREKQYKRFDEKGLYLLVKPNGSRLWRFKYRFNGRENHLALGAFPEVGLKEARQRRDDARLQLRDNVDPASVRRANKAVGQNTLASIADEWIETQRHQLAASTLDKAKNHLETNVLPYLGTSIITDIAAPEILRLLRRIESKGHHETAHRVRQRLSQVFRYAIATGKCDRDPTVDLRGALKPVVTTSRSAITNPEEVKHLLRSIDAYSGHPLTRLALQLLSLTFVRPGELRLAHWAEVDLASAVWRIPAERMKMKREHLVPLSSQAVKVFEELQQFSGDKELVFESLRAGRPLSENTLNLALRTMGFGGDVMTAHGFRALASTLLHELGWPPEVIELQLSHAQRNQVAAAYNRSARLKERVEMMQAWAGYLGVLRSTGLNE